jgi:hypothetical protein
MKNREQIQNYERLSRKGSILLKPNSFLKSDDDNKNNFLIKNDGSSTVKTRFSLIPDLNANTPNQ